jgi:hypothetical protein
MATTTNFGWTTPDDSEAVNNGALAIRSLGAAIDTSLVDLKGGTTGQTLSKTTNDDMDFTWQTPVAGSMTLLSTTSLSGTSTVISSISQLYTSLYIEGYEITFTANSALRINLNSTINMIAVNGVQNSSPAQSTNIQPFSAVLTPSNSLNAFVITIGDYTSTKIKNLYYSGTTVAVGTFFGGISKDVSAISSIECTTAAGTSTIGGTVLIYGVN